MPVIPCTAPPRSVRTSLLGAALVALSASAYGSGPLFARSVYATGMDWLTMLAWRFALATVATWLWLLAFSSRRAALARLGRRRALRLFSVGGLFACSSASAYASLELIPVTVYGIIQAISPLLVAVLTLRFGRRLEGRLAWVALSIAIIGLALTVGAVSAPASAAGLVLAAAAPAIYAVYILLLSREAGERQQAVAVEAPSPPPAATIAGAILLTAAGAGFTTLALVAREPILPWQVPHSAWPGLLGVGLVSAAIPMQAFYAGATRIGAANAALITTLEPVSTVTLAMLLLGERLTVVQALGGMLVVSGVVLSQARLGSPRRDLSRTVSAPPKISG